MLFVCYLLIELALLLCTYRVYAVRFLFTGWTGSSCCSFAIKLCDQEVELEIMNLEELREKKMQVAQKLNSLLEERKISAKDFALSMVASADINHINKFLDQVDELGNIRQLRDTHITLEEFKAFAELRRSLQPFALAIFSYGKANGLLTKRDFQRVASYVCGITIPDHVVDLVFHVFDTNQDGSLSTDEFLRALQRWEYSDVRHQSDRGFSEVLSCCLKCTKNT